jgi:hypothetical protein
MKGKKRRGGFVNGIDERWWMNGMMRKEKKDVSMDREEMRVKRIKMAGKKKKGWRYEKEKINKNKKGQ